MQPKQKNDESMRPLLKKILKALSTPWGVVISAFTLVGIGFTAGSVMERNLLRAEYALREVTIQKQQMEEQFKLQEKILNLEADLRDCERERHK